VFSGLKRLAKEGEAMWDVELYQQILGLEEPWSVRDVELNIDEGRVDIHIEHSQGVKWKCPHCERELGCYDHSPERTWRHLDTCQLETHLHARIPRVQCPEHGVVQVAVHWAEGRGRFTLLMERFIIQALLACQTTQGACELLRISWDQAWHVAQRAVARGQARKQAVVTPQIGVDEKAFRKGHSYVTVVNDIERGTVEFVTEGREASLERYFTSLTDEQRQGIEAVDMDMWEHYVQATLEALPLAKEKIAFGRFHIVQHMTKAVGQVRKAENRKLSSEGDVRLKKTKYLWLTTEQNLSEKQRPTFAALKVSDLKTARAWGDQGEPAEPVELHIARLGEAILWRVVRLGQPQPPGTVAAMLQRRLENVVTYCKHFVTNAVAEGLNSKIMSIKRRAGGFRNPENFKTAIYFHCGGLSLYP
jgi:transposase